MRTRRTIIERRDPATPGDGTDVPLHLFTLWASLPTVQTRERGREGRIPLEGSVAECHREIEEHLGELGTTVDAEDRDVAAIATWIDARLASR